MTGYFKLLGYCELDNVLLKLLHKKQAINPFQSNVTFLYPLKTFSGEIEM